MSLTQALNDPGRREKVIDDCVLLVDSEVSKKSGLGGMVIKTGYKAVKGVRPGFIKQVVSSLLDEWAARLDPIWQEAVAANKSPRAHFEAERSRVAEALLAVTDEKSHGAKNALVKSTYNKLRPTAKKHVEEAAPALGDLLARHA